MSRRLRRVGLMLVAAGALFGACHDSGNTNSVNAEAVFEHGVIDFGTVPVGEWREAKIKVSNAGHVPFKISDAVKLGDSNEFFVKTPNGFVPAFSSLDVTVRFHPLKEGPSEDRVQVNVDAIHKPEDSVIQVRGAGGPTPMQFDPPILDFQTLEIDSDRTLDVTIRNPADLQATLKLDGPAVTEFGSSLATIPPNGTIKLTVRFAPVALGDRKARIEARVCETCSPASLEMTGLSVPDAFDFTPDPIPFQPTPVHSKTTSWGEMTNITWRPVTVRNMAPDQGFKVTTDLKDRKVNPGEKVRFDMEFEPLSTLNGGKLVVHYDSDHQRQAPVLLDATGGSPQLAVTPIDIDFGRLPVGGKLGHAVRLTNAGVQGNLHITGVRADGAQDQFGIGNPADAMGVPHPWNGGAWPALTAPDVPIAPGAADFVQVQVFFNPTQVGTFEGQVIFQSDDHFTPERAVHVRGESFDAGICKGRLLPQPKLDFGNVAVGQWATLGFRFENAGTDTCAVKDIRISNDSGGVFTMPGGELAGGVVLQNDAFSAMIAFHSDTPGVFQGELEVTVNDPANPRMTLQLVGVAMPSCLAAAPPLLNFGPIRFDCQPTPRSTHVTNVCNKPLHVNAIYIGPGTSDQFHIAQAPGTPLTLGPGEGFEVQVTYDRTILGQHYSPLFVAADGEPGPFLIPMWAETNHSGNTIDRFVQGASGQLDVLFVMSNTTTMGAAQDRLATDVPPWLAAAQTRGLSLQVGVTSTGLTERGTCPAPVHGGEAGRLFPAEGGRPRFIQGQVAQAGVLQQNVHVGACHNLVQGLETMRAALTPPLANNADDPRTPLPNDGNLGFSRPTARLAVIFVADEDDHSGFSPESYIQFLRGLKGPNMGHRAQAWALIPNGSNLCTTAGPNGDRFAAVAKGTGGLTGGICSPSYAGLLGAVLARATGPQADFKLSFPLRGEDEITVTVDGKIAPPGTWHFDVGTNSVIFETGSVPKEGQTIEVSYVGDCSVIPQ